MAAELTLSDHATNALQAAILAVPVVGPSLEKLMFGSLAELRMKRVERTLHEVGEKLAMLADQIAIDDNPDFAAILEKAIPHLARSRGETKRQRFRDLITNAARIPVGSTDWEGIELAETMIEELDEAALEVFSLIYRPPIQITNESSIERPKIILDDSCCAIVLEHRRELPSRITFEVGMQEYWKAFLSQRERAYKINLDRAIVFESVRRLRDRRLVDTYVDLSLFIIVQSAPLGSLLVRWCLSDKSDTAP